MFQSFEVFGAKRRAFFRFYGREAPGRFFLAVIVVTSFFELMIDSATPKVHPPGGTTFVTIQGGDFSYGTVTQPFKEVRHLLLADQFCCQVSTVHKVRTH